MRSLHLVKTSTGGTWAFRLMRELVSMGEEVHVAMPIDGPLVQKYKESGITIHELCYSITKPFKTIKAIRNVVKEVNPDIVHSHFVVCALLMRIALRHDDTKRVFEVPGPLHLEHILYRAADILSAQKSKDFWIATCQWSYNRYLKAGINQNRIFLTYYGGDLVDVHYPKGKLRQELGLSNDNFIVGMVAYMYAPKRFLGERRGLKGHEDLIDAVSLIQDKYPHLHLIIIGGAWDGAAAYEQQVIAYGKKKVRNIHFLGTRTDVPELYQDINVVVHPSHSENLGGAGESLILGVPTIATNTGGFPDIVRPGETGYLVPVCSPIKIAQAIEEVISYPEKAMELAQNGKRLLFEKLDAKKTSMDVYRFYRAIVSM